jgi:hypothetical protein
MEDNTQEERIENAYTGSIVNNDYNLETSTPYTIVWTALPLITWMLPPIGHTGITDSQGVIYDFAGPYTVQRGELAFGRPLKTIRLKVDPSRTAEWDLAVKRANGEYCKRMHNLCCDNCHSHVALALNEFKYNGKSSHNMLTVWWMTIVSSRYRRYSPPLTIAGWQY